MFFRSGFSAYILGVRHILESILAHQTTKCGTYCKISFAHVCIINAPPELKTTGNFLSFDI